MKLLKYLALTLTFLYVQSLQAQPTKEELTKQRQALVKEIDELNNSLKGVQGQKKVSLKELEKRKRKVEVIEELVGNINKKIKGLDDDLYLKQVEIYRLNKELDTLKAKYKKSIVYAYKNKSNYQYLNFLFSSKSFNDALKRVAFLKGYRKLREQEADNIVKAQTLIKDNIVQLNNTKADKEQTLVAQNEQLLSLEEAKKEQEQTVNEIKGKEKEIFAQLNKKEEERRKLSNAITAVIKKEQEEARKAEAARLARLKAEAEARKKQLEAEAKAKKEAAAKAKIEAEQKAKELADANAKAKAAEKLRIAEQEARIAEEKLQTQKKEASNIGVVTIGTNGQKRSYSEFETTKDGLILSENFEKNRKRLPWPVANGQVCGEFGVTRHMKIDVKRDGIEICTKVGVPVMAVSSGEVTQVQDLGDYSYIMVRHGRYSTIYNKVAGVNVRIGQKINVGEVIGKVALGDDGDGDFEFMVMNGTKFENPRNWLRNN